MKKSFVVILIIISALCSGCSRQPSTAALLTDCMNAVVNSGSASVTASFIMDGMVNQTVGTAAYDLTAMADGVIMSVDGYTDYWDYSISMTDPVTGDWSLAYRTASAAGSDGSFTFAKRVMPGDTWSVMKDRSEPDHYFTSLISSFIQGAASDEQTNTYMSVVKGDDVLALFQFVVNRDEQMDLSALKLSDRTFLATLALDDSGRYIKSLQIDCKTFGVELAELLSNRHGLALSINSATLTLEFCDYGRIRDIELPPLVRPEDNNLF